MKVLYFGTVCNREHYLAMQENFRIQKPAAPLVFETALLKGFRENGVELEAVSFPSIPAFPKSKYVCWGRTKEKLEFGYSTTWIPAVNIHGIKQLCQRYFSHCILKKWLKENADEEKAVLIYSAYQPISKSIVRLCGRYHTKCYAIIPDLPRDMYSVVRIGAVKKALSKLYVWAAEKVQGCFDGYIYLTEAMKEVINPTAPYTVVEGIANASEARMLTVADKVPEFAIMYAGTLNEKFGIRNLLEAFQELDRKDAQLWIFGSGDFQEKIKEYTKTDGRIQFFGSVPREQVLEYEKKAALLVNVRDGKDEFTKYSFPSKVIEYMLSGTPMLMTKLPGIPAEYYDYTYVAENNDIKTLREALEKVCAKPQEELISFGARAQAFIASEKNSRVQVAKIMNLICR